jgi:hypothetical protein
MFVGDEVLLGVSFAVARERLAQLTQGGALISASENAYGHGTAGLTGVGPRSLTKLVRVQVRELTWTDKSAGLAIRWEASGPDGTLFPVLDADITLARAGEQGTWLSVAGVCRSPFGLTASSLERSILDRAAAVTVSNFMAGVAAQIAGRPREAQAASPNGAGATPPPA